MDWSTRSITTVDGLRLAVYEAGPTDPDAARGPNDPPVVVMVHGYPEQHAVWDLVAADLATGHRVVAYDVRGAGGSQLPFDIRGWRMERLLDDLALVIDTALDSEGEQTDGAVHLVGHDWGSIQGWSFVLHPDHHRRVASFTSMCGPALVHVDRRVRRWFAEGASGWAAAARQAVSSAYIAFFQTPVAPWAWRRVLGPRWPQMVRREPVICDERWPAPTVGQDASDGVWLYRAHRRAMLPPFRSDRLPPAMPTTPVPVRLLVATDDPNITTGLVDGLDELAEDCVRIETDGGHWLPRSRPQVVIDAVRAATGRPSGPGAGDD